MNDIPTDNRMKTIVKSAADQSGAFEFVDGEEIWKLHATYGLPVEASLLILAQYNSVPAWESLLRSAQADGANLRRLGDRLIQAAADAGYPSLMIEWMEIAMPRLVDILENEDEI